MKILRGALLLLWIVRAPGAGAPDAQALLQRAIPKALSIIERMPACTCVQTVDRAYIRVTKIRSPNVCDETLQDPLPARDRIASADRLRLEVTMAAQGEIFSWAGASHFEDGSIDRVVTNGAIGSGTFAGCLSAAFREHGRRLTFNRNLIVNRRRLIEYVFLVDQPDSGYRVPKFLAADDGVTVAYTGTVQIDAETGDVVAVGVRTAKLPSDAGNCRTLTHIDFVNIRLG